MLGIIKIICFTSFSLLWSTAYTADFDSGSDGSYGPVLVDATSGHVTIDLPPDGIIHATTVTVTDGRTLTFNKNALNTPVYLLATGDIMITNGKITVNGQDANSFNGGAGGPGGFDGGKPGISADLPGAGYGPGAGLSGTKLSDGTEAGNAGYGTAGGTDAPDGVSYGSQLLMPMLGGSGGGGVAGKGGGGGGGAILIASNTLIELSITNVSIQAQGGRGYTTTKGDGSGGAIRLVAPVIAGNGRLDVNSVSGTNLGNGRIRIDLIDRSQFGLRFVPLTAPVTLGSFMQVFPDTIPHLDIIHVAGEDIAEGSNAPVSITLPFNAPANQQVTVQATDLIGLIPIRVVFTPDSGEPIIVDGDIDMSNGNPASVTLNADLPQNIALRVHAWTR